jgi:hypothetical protein
MHRGIGTHEVEAVWQKINGRKVLGLKRTNACACEQVRATQQLKNEQVGQTRSCTKAARTQATPSVRTSSSDRGCRRLRVVE